MAVLPFGFRCLLELSSSLARHSVTGVASHVSPVVTRASCQEQASPLQFLVIVMVVCFIYLWPFREVKKNPLRLGLGTQWLRLHSNVAGASYLFPLEALTPCTL